MVKAVFIGGPKHDQWILLDDGEHALPERLKFVIDTPGVLRRGGFDVRTHHYEYAVLGKVTDLPYVLCIYAGRCA